MSKVFVRKAEYDYKTLKPVFFEIMDATAGNMIQKNMRVVIKPNLLAPASPEMAVVTHPLIIKAAVEYVLEKGARPVISDSSAAASFEKILKEGGIRNALEGLNVEFREFKTSAAVDVGKPFNEIEIAGDAVNADFLINLPKLKTHAQMLLTLGIKNLFGCIVGMKKPEWHFRTGVDREMFAKLLVKIYQAVRPSVTIMDGILAMQGQGPGKGGEPRNIGVVLGSSDTAAVDIAVCKMFGIAPDELLTNRFAMEQGLTTEIIEMDGDLPDIKDFKFPEIVTLVFGPRKFHGFMRRHLVQRPVCNDSLCRLCGECWKYCPAKAITHDKRKIDFDYDKCIRCYCCIEVCPHGALSAHETATGRIARRLLKI
ncbi:MAG: DUF362 domain-containing protein [Nitrospirae bacterium]|nr:DUF362 domain-containing protein [Nitrospirota bacterium]